MSLSVPHPRAIDQMMRRLDQRALAHAARAPQQGVVGGQPLGKAARVLDQDVAREVDPLEQADIDPVDPGYWLQPAVARCQTNAAAEAGSTPRADGARAGPAPSAIRSRREFRSWSGGIDTGRSIGPQPPPGKCRGLQRPRAPAIYPRTPTGGTARSLPMFVTQAFAQTAAARDGRFSVHDPALGHDHGDLLFPADPAAAAQGQGAPGNWSPRCSAAIQW